MGHASHHDQVTNGPLKNNDMLIYIYIGRPEDNEFFGKMHGDLHLTRSINPSTNTGSAGPRRFLPVNFVVWAPLLPAPVGAPSRQILPNITQQNPQFLSCSPWASSSFKWPVEIAISSANLGPCSWCRSLGGFVENVCVAPVFVFVGVSNYFDQPNAMWCNEIVITKQIKWSWILGFPISARFPLAVSHNCQHASKSCPPYRVSKF